MSDHNYPQQHEAEQDDFSFKKLFVPLTTLKAIHIIFILGIIVFINGIFNQFVLDDVAQITKNLAIQSIKNIWVFFTGSTFYNGGELTGVYYKPLLVTFFSLIHNFFGSNYFIFHLFQIMLHIVNASLLFLIFKHFFPKQISLVFALIFLIHPINSEAVFYISNMQDVLFLFFGLLALYILINNKSKKQLGVVVLCLFFSILSKETGILFFVVSIIYSFIFYRKFLYPLLAYSSLVFVVYLVLRVSAVGIFIKPMNAPIATLSLIERFFNMPAIFFYYIKTFLFPVDLSSSYQWVIRKVTFSNFFLPLMVDLLYIGAICYFPFILYKKYLHKYLKSFVFFSLWFIFGMLLHLQILPLDATVAERWFYFPIIGLLGMIGVFLNAIHFKLTKKWVVLIVIIILVFSTRTFMRSFDWRDQLTLQSKDIQVSKDDYVLENGLGSELILRNRLQEAQAHVERSIKLYPHFSNYSNLGIIYTNLGSYDKAREAYLKALEYGDIYIVYSNLAGLALMSGDPKENISFIEYSLEKFPNDGKLWAILAILEYRLKNVERAKEAIVKAYFYNRSSEIRFVYEKIMNNEPLILKYITE